MAGDFERQRRRNWTLAVVAALVAPILWLAPVFDPLAPTEIDRLVSAPAAESPPRRVLLVSIDGLAPRLVVEANAPGLARRRREGATVGEALTITPSLTLPSHASMLSGVGPEVHGISWNRYQPWSRLAAPTLFTSCAEQGLRCDLFVSKRKFAHFAEHEAGVRRYRYREAAAEVLDDALDSLRSSDPDLVVIHLSELDHAGHADGWASPLQLLELARLDTLLSEFLAAALQASPRPLTVLITADHGGLGTQHREDRPENRRIPWILWGDGVDPTLRVQSVSTLDTAATIAQLLGLAIPNEWAGRSHWAPAPTYP